MTICFPKLKINISLYPYMIYKEHYRNYKSSCLKKKIDIKQWPGSIVIKTSRLLAVYHRRLQRLIQAYTAVKVNLRQNVFNTINCSIVSWLIYSVW